MGETEQVLTVVTAELQGASGVCREFVEGKEAMEAVAQLEEALFERFDIGGARNFATPPEHASYPVSAKALTRALDTERAMAETEQMQRDIETKYRQVRRKLPERAPRVPTHTQPSVQDFLNRPFHEVKRNRFLFCEATDESSFSNNPGYGWNDAIALAHLADGQRGSFDRTLDHGECIKRNG